MAVAGCLEGGNHIGSRHHSVGAERVCVLTATAGTWIVAGFILVLNLPFGFWRAGARRFSPSWFLAVHAPVPIAIGARFLAGVGLRLRLLPLFIGVYFAGQFLGGRARTLRKSDTAL